MPDQLAGADDARAIDQQIEPIHRLASRVDGCRDLRFGADIAIEESRPDLLGQGPTGLFLHIEDHGASALGDDALDDRAAQTGRPSGDHAQDVIEIHAAAAYFKLIVVFTPAETPPSSNQREVMVLVCV